MEKGMEKGKKEEKKAIALKMLNENLDFDTISNLTGLNRKEIEELKASKTTRVKTVAEG